MNNPDSGSQPITESWDTYWHGAKQNDAFTGGGSTHPVVRAFWDDLFAAAAAGGKKLRLVDIAGGNGAVIERANSVLTSNPPESTCVDISESAIKMVEQRIPGVRGVVADARAIPLASKSFDIVSSQFGIEYAGLDAIDGMMRLVADGGQIALLIHHKSGGIYRQCAASLEALEKLQKSKFIPNTIATFEAGFAACRGADRGPYEAAARQLVPALRAVEAIMMQHGRNVADDTIVKLYQDVGAVHKRLQHYDPAEVLGWLSRMQEEIQAYVGRMSSMCAAAIDQETFERLCDKVRRQGFKLQRTDTLAVPDRDVPLAWALIARRG